MNPRRSPSAGRWPPAAGALTAVLVVLLYLCVGVFDHEIWAPVEPTVAGIVWNMADGGGLAVPYVNHEPFVEKPPFYYWLAVLAARAGGGLDAGTLRLPAAVLGMACLGLLFWIARREWGSRVACGTTLLAASSVMLWDTAHRAASDVAANFFAFLCFALFARAQGESDTSSPAARRWDLALAVALGASFFAKNIFTFFLVLPPVTIALLLRGEWRRWGRLLGTAGAVLVALLVPWLVAIYLDGGWEPVRIVVFDNTLGRFLPITEYAPAFTTPMSDALLAEKEPLLFYLPRLLAYPLPWTPIFLVALVDLVRRRAASSEVERFLLIGVVTLPVALSASAAKSTDYLVPIVFFDLLIVGRFLAEVLVGGRRLATWERVLVVGNVIVALVLLAVFPIVLVGVFGGVATLLLAPPAAWLAWRLFTRLREGPVDARWVFDFGATAVLAATIGLAIAIPHVDEQKSYRPFFDEARARAEGRTLVTTYREISRLPMMNFYLGSRLHVLGDFDPLIGLLRSSEPIAAFVRCRTYDEHRVELEGARLLREPERGSMCLLTNPLRAG